MSFHSFSVEGTCKIKTNKVSQRFILLNYNLFNFQIIRNTQDEDHVNFPTPLEEHGFEVTDEPADTQEDQIQEDIIVTPSTSKRKATTNTKRLSYFTPQTLHNKKRKVENSIEQAINKLQSISNECKEAEDDEFDLFCKSLASHLRKMPLKRALACQEKLQSVVTQERLQQITYTSPPQHSNSSVYSTTSSYSPNFTPSEEYPPSEDVISQALLTI